MCVKKKKINAFLRLSLHIRYTKRVEACMHISLSPLMYLKDFVLVFISVNRSLDF